MIFIRENTKEEPEEPRVVNTEHDPGHSHNHTREVVVLSKHLMKRQR